jgi:hypothetical protein
MVDLLAQAHPKFFDGWHLWKGIWPDSARLICFGLVLIAFFQVIAYWKELSKATHLYEDSRSRANMSLGALGLLIYVSADQLSKMGHTVSWRLPIAFIAIIWLLRGG